MGQHDADHDDADETEEEYPLSQPEPTAADYQPRAYPRYRSGTEEEPPGQQRFQFTLRELFWLVTGVAIVLGILGSIPGGYSMEVLAGLAGLGLLVSLVALGIVQPTRPIVRLAWWVLLAFYALASLVAVVQSLL